MEKHSEEIKNILGRPPRYLVRFGSVLIAVALLAILLAMTFIRYPQKVKGRLVMTTIDPPISIVPQTSGYISLFREEGTTVQKGEQVAIISNQAEYQDVVQLEQEVIKLMEFEEDDYLSYIPNEGWLLGDIQEAYNEFSATIQDFEVLKNNKSDENKKGQYRTQINNTKRSVQFLEDEIRTLEREMKIQENTRAKKQIELVEGEIRDSEYNQYLTAIENTRRLITNKKLNKEALEAEISNFKFDIFGENIKVRSGNFAQFKNIKKKLTQLKDAIEKWKAKYILQAPVEGKVTFYDAQIAQQFIAKGDEFMAIVPEHTEEDVIGKVQLSLIGSGRVEQGQRVLIKFDIYPYLEYGYVEGIVDSKARLPNPKEEKYNLQIKLPSGLLTSRGDTLEFRQNMLADAEIITEDASLLKRVFASVFGLFK